MTSIATRASVGSITMRAARRQADRPPERVLDLGLDAEGVEERRRARVHLDGGGGLHGLSRPPSGLAGRAARAAVRASPTRGDPALVRGAVGRPRSAGASADAPRRPGASATRRRRAGAAGRSAGGLDAGAPAAGASGGARAACGAGTRGCGRRSRRRRVTIRVASAGQDVADARETRSLSSWTRRGPAALEQAPLQVLPEAVELDEVGLHLLVRPSVARGPQDHGHPAGTSRPPSRRRIRSRSSPVSIRRETPERVEFASRTT